MNDVEGQTSIFYWHNGDSKLYFYQSGAISQRSLLLNYVYDMRREVVLIGDDISRSSAVCMKMTKISEISISLVNRNPNTPLHYPKVFEESKSILYLKKIAENLSFNFRKIINCLYYCWSVSWSK